MCVWPIRKIWLLLLFGLAPLKTFSQCPVSPSKIRPEVIVAVEQNSSSFVYRYEIENKYFATLSIDDFNIAIDTKPSNIMNPEKWISSYDEVSGNRNIVSWTAASNEIKPSQKRKGFSIASSSPPGPVYYYASGLSSVVTIQATQDDDEPIPDCPYLFNDKSMLDGLVRGVTIGPVKEGTGPIPAEIELLNQSMKPREKSRINPLEGGNLIVILEGTDVLDIDAVDLTSIEFGEGKAKPIFSKVVNDHSFQKQWRKDRKPYWWQKPPTREAKKKNLLLKFKVADIGLRCNLDHALFINGKLKEGKKFWGGVNIQPMDCEELDALKKKSRGKTK